MIRGRIKAQVRYNRALLLRAKRKRAPTPLLVGRKRAPTPPLVGRKRQVKVKKAMRPPYVKVKKASPRKKVKRVLVPKPKPKSRVSRRRGAISGR